MSQEHEEITQKRHIGQDAGSKIMSALEILSATRKPSFEVIPTSFAQIATKITSYYKVHPQNTSSHKVHYTTTIFNP